MPFGKPLISIDDFAHQTDVQVLNLFVSKILQNEWLSEKTKADSLKIINNIKYIKLNLDYVLYCVDNKNDLTIYRYPTDRRKGVLRDREGTSFHINSYHHAQEAKNDLSRFIADFEAAVDRLTEDAAHPIVFLQAIEALEWENEIGCIEKRTEKFLKTAVETVLPSNEQLAHVFTKIYIPKVNHPASFTVAEALTAFEQAFSLQNIREPLLICLREILTIEETDTLSAAFDLGNSSSFPVTRPPDHDLLFKLTDHKLPMDAVVSLLNSTDPELLNRLLNKNCPINKKTPLANAVTHWKGDVFILLMNKVSTHSILMNQVNGNGTCQGNETKVCLI